MEKCGNLSGNSKWQACSACAGDYEDPDWTAPEELEDLWEEDEEELIEGQVEQGRRR
ncbi:MAG: hypothetical protein M3P45_14350 [Acidobacteriota bacterium]|nr:hypothetical protein [Acidobacteriota bacterium]